MDVIEILVVGSLAFLIGGTVKGLAGLGLPTTALGIMTLTLGPRIAISLVLFPMLGGNLWQAYRAGLIGRTMRRYWVFALVLLLGVFATVMLTKDTDDRVLLAVLGAVLLIFVAISVKGWMPVLPERWDPIAQAVGGAVSGVIGGMTAGWGAPLAMYLATRGVEKDEFIRASGFLITVGSLPLCIGYIGLGFMTGPLAGVSLAMLVPTLVGFTIGERLRSRLSVEGFRRLLLIVFVLLGLNLIRRAIWYV
ncbi:sulfite exporter TauE/SafE family protein [Alphaproteobacteria bacterium KMM 3653]|uniref:Probable membrane transporter protein n=1 Tax=Harenicola maris TaxID=2841044 RepID=A0AAP2GAH3_9RHOB|nr:sulfite exporter TauE/SafE family protein [Harenicola maris]